LFDERNTEVLKARDAWALFDSLNNMLVVGGQAEDQAGELSDFFAPVASRWLSFLLAIVIVLS